MESKKQTNSIVSKIFSTQSILVAIFLVLAYWVFFGGDSKEESNPAVTSSGQPIVGVGNVVNADAAEQLGIDLTEQLDPKLIPSLVEQAMKETAEAGVSEEQFVQTLVTKVSTKLQQISLIDLNNDGLVDPLLVTPAQVSEGAEHLLLSIRVPDPAEVKQLPEGTDQEAWADIVENKSIELMSTAAVQEGGDNMTIQTSANPQTYPSHPPYYHHHTSLSSILLTSMMISWMMTPRYYPPMGYGGHQATRVSTAQQNRNANTSSLKSAQSSNTPAKTASGNSVASNNFKKVPPKSLNQIRTTQFRARNAAQGTNRTGGFGQARQSSNNVQRPSGNVNKPQATPQRTFKKPARRSYGGFGKRKR